MKHSINRVLKIEKSCLELQVFATMAYRRFHARNNTALISFREQVENIFSNMKLRIETFVDETDFVVIR